jgi:hypothetical protein
MIIKCSRCKKELTKLGGLAFSPPTLIETVYKYHLCFECWQLFIQWIRPKENKHEE